MEIELKDKPEEEQTDSGGTALIVILVFAVLVFLFAMFLGLNQEYFHFRYWNKVFYPSDKDYKVPKGYKIVSDGKYYAVMIVDSGAYENGQLLYHGKYGIEPYPRSIAYCDFLDSANAKGLLKVYLADKESERKTGTEFK